MSGTDQVVINTRERASSGDINDLQSLKDRTLLDSWLEAFQRRSYLIGLQPTEISQPIVLGGLELGPSGSDIAIQPGVLLQDSTTLLPVPGALDSDYRWSALRSSVIETNPAPGADTWFLVEAQMSAIVAATATRDIFDTGTGLFVPTLVDKRTERTIATQLLIGTPTDLPLPTGGDFIVIGAVLVPTGGGAIPAANFIDMRPLWTDLDGAVRPVASQGKRQSEIETLGDPGDFTKEVVIAAEAWTLGRRLWFETSQAGILLTANIAIFREPGTNPQTAQTTSFLYLVPIRDGGTTRPILARNLYAHAGLSVFNGNAMLIWTTTSPGADRETNSAPMVLPAPFSLYTVQTGEAVCIGALYNQTGSDDLVSMGPDGVNVTRIHKANAADVLTGLSDSIVPTGGADAITISDLPECAKLVHYRLEWEDNGTGSTDEELLIQPTGGGVGNRFYQFKGNWNVVGQVYFTLPPVTAFEIEFDGAQVPPVATVEVLGWSL